MMLVKDRDVEALLKFIYLVGSAILPDKLDNI